MRGNAAPNPLRRRRLPIAAILATAALSLPAAGCAGSGPSTRPGGPPNRGGSKTSASAVAYSTCVRSHGVPNYPDPDRNGQLPKTDAGQLGVSSARYDAAQRACRHLLPIGGSLRAREDACMQTSDCSPTLEQQMMNADRKLAQCMRSHGLPKFPDPTNGGSRGPWFNISSVGISDAESHTRQFIARLDECGRLVGENAPESFG